ncbi:glycine N-acyltransferase-like protein 3 [Ambystoma mexicanum]|uniref:glycine N-acyltransferase-like protein 3 n=1 Tax=Ambystoma mexicanum TaxID=8296 RepID=UPI0037E7B1EB
MLLLKCQDQLLHLQNDLENLIPLSLKVYASILKIRKGNPFLQDVLVDSWPDFNAVLVRPQREGQSSDFDTYRNSYVYFFKDPGSIPESFMEAFDWTQAFEVQGLQCSLQAMLVNAAQIRQARAEMATLITFIQEKETCVSIPNLSGPKMAEMPSLSVSHTELVDKTWAFGGSDSSQQYVKTCIENSPSRCLMTNDCRTPISWALTDQYGAIRMAYTLPQHRGKGYAKCIISSLSDELRQGGFPVYCHVEEDNTSSKALFKSLGFIEVISAKLLWFHSSPAAK